MTCSVPRRDVQRDMQLAVCIDHPPLNKGMWDIPTAPWIFFHLPKYCEPVRPWMFTTHKPCLRGNYIAINSWSNKRSANLEMLQKNLSYGSQLMISGFPTTHFSKSLLASAPLKKKKKKHFYFKEGEPQIRLLKAHIKNTLNIFSIWTEIFVLGEVFLSNFLC